MRVVDLLLTASAAHRGAVPIMRLPDTVRDLLPAEVVNHAIFYQAAENNWNALSECYPSEAEGLEAIQANVAVILPYGADSPTAGFLELGDAVDRSQNIAGSYVVLMEKLDGDKAAVLEVITKNPGVLGCVPGQLDKASADEIRRTASISAGVYSVFGGARRFLQSQDWWDEGKSNLEKQQQKAEEESPSFNPFSFGDEAADADAEPLLLPQIAYDGETYMYDRKGDYNGVEHCLLTLEGEPVGVWNPETGEPEEVEFVDEESD